MQLDFEIDKLTHSIEDVKTGEILFFSKTKLIEHYEKTLGAVHIGGHRMIIYEREAQNLIKKYYPNL